jgi:hypothetical protein
LQVSEHHSDRLPVAFEVAGDLARGDVSQILSGTRKTANDLKQSLPT